MPVGQMVREHSIVVTAHISEDITVILMATESRHFVSITALYCLGRNKNL